MRPILIGAAPVTALSSIASMPTIVLEGGATRRADEVTVSSLLGEGIHATSIAA
jgi:hypothetical protein